MSHDRREMSRRDKPDLTTDERRQIVALAEEGIPLAVIAAKFGVTRQALYMHKGRKSEFGKDMARAIERAYAGYVIGTMRRMRSMADEKNSCWTQAAWELQRLRDQFDKLFQTPQERASVAVAAEQVKNLRRQGANPNADAVPDERFA